MEAASFYLEMFYRCASLLFVWLVFKKLDRVLHQLGVMQREAKIMANSSQEELEILIQAIADENTEIDGAIVLIDSIPALIASAGTDPVKIAELVNLVQSKSAALKAALVTNTPSSGAAPAPAAPPASPASTGTDAGTPPPAGDTSGGASPADSGAASGTPPDAGTPPAS